MPIGEHYRHMPPLKDSLPSLCEAAVYVKGFIQSHRAGAVAFEGGFQPGGAPARWKTWVRGGYFRSTGDGDPSDDRQTTFFQALPTT